jgi:hypothetical protein
VSRVLQELENLYPDKLLHLEFVNDDIEFYDGDWNYVTSYRYYVCVNKLEGELN